MHQVAMPMTESEFQVFLEDTVRPVDGVAKVIPTQGYTNTGRTVVKTVSFGVLSSMEKREAVYEALYAFAHSELKVLDYEGWKLNVEDKTFTTAIHTITVKLHKNKGCMNV